ncbi:hypothetical protein ABW19_dt0200893 [Dactylella cylindrospora]|nr:hypothetical protein ABW19_dt0200893 [Dactylella cylindrospora]
MITNPRHHCSTTTLLVSAISLLVILTLTIHHVRSARYIPVDYFPAQSSLESPTALYPDADESNDNNNTANPLLTQAGLDDLILSHAYSRNQPHQASFSSLRHLCKTTQWNQNLYFSCIHNVGGLINARNMVLNCIRYAIAAGATGLILPKVEVREAGKLEVLRTGVFRGFGYYFDVGWFENVMEMNCRRMRVVKEVEEVEGWGEAVMPEVLSVKKVMGEEEEKGWRNTKASDFRQKFDQYLGTLNRGPSGNAPIIIRLDDKMLFSYPPSTDDPNLRDNFGSILNFRYDLIALSNIIIDRLRQSLDHISNTTNTPGSSEYLGVHLRTESDVPPIWAKLEDIAHAALLKAVNTGIKLIYVGTGDISGFHDFRYRASGAEIIIADKWRMLNENEKELLRTYGFDQQAVVDYLVLMQADRLVGSSWSSFSSNLVLTREFLVNGTRWEGEKDERNELVGSEKFEYLDMMWP